MRSDQIAQFFVEQVNKSPRLELMTPLQSDTIYFRYLPQENLQHCNDINKIICNYLLQQGIAIINYAQLGDDLVLRYVIAHSQSSEDDIIDFLDVIMAAGYFIEQLEFNAKQHLITEQWQTVLVNHQLNLSETALHQQQSLICAFRCLPEAYIASRGKACYQSGYESCMQTLREVIAKQIEPDLNALVASIKPIITAIESNQLQPPKKVMGHYKYFLSLECSLISACELLVTCTWSSTAVVYVRCFRRSRSNGV